MTRNQQHASLICGTRTCKTYMAKINNGKYRSLMLVMVFFSAWLTLHFVRVTIEYHHQVVKDSVQQAMKLIAKEDGFVEDSTSSTLPFNDAETSTEAIIVDTIKKNPDSKLLQLIQNNIKQFNDKPNQKDSDMTTNTLPFTSSTPDIFPLKRDDIGNRPLDTNKGGANIPERVTNDNWGSSTEASTTENIIGNTAANVNINDQHLKIDSGQQYIVQPGENDITDNTKIVGGHIYNKQNDFHAVTSSDYSTESTTTPLFEDKSSNKGDVDDSVKQMLVKAFGTNDDLMNDSTHSSPFIPEPVSDKSVNQEMNGQQSQSLDNGFINQNQPINQALQTPNQVANMIASQQIQPNNIGQQQSVQQQYQNNGQQQYQLSQQGQPNNQPLQQPYQNNGQQVQQQYQPNGQQIQQPLQYNGQQTLQQKQRGSQFFQQPLDLLYNGQQIQQYQPNVQPIQQPMQYNGQQFQIQPQYKLNNQQLKINPQYAQNTIVENNQLVPPLPPNPLQSPQLSVNMQQLSNPLPQPTGNIQQSNNLSDNRVQTANQAEALEEQIQQQQRQIQEQQVEIHEQQQQQQMQLQNKQI